MENVKGRAKLGILFCAAVLGLGSVALAQPKPATEPQPNPTVAALPPDRPTVTRFDPPAIQLGGTVTLLVPDIDSNKDKNHTDLNQAILYINGLPLTDAHPRRDGNTLVFDLRKNPESFKTWAAVLGQPNGYTRDVDLTVGFNDGSKWLSTAHGKIVVIPKGWFLFWAAILAVVVGLFIYFAVTTNILRDSEPEPGHDRKKTLSLSRLQMAIWFFVVLGSFALIHVITNDTNVSTTALTLMGVSMGTGLAASVVDSNKRSAAKTLAESLTAERGTIIKRLEELKSQLSISGLLPGQAPAVQGEVNDRVARLAAVNNQLTSVQQSLAPQAAQGVASDLLTDANGAALHRFQLAAWTIVLVIVFLRRVYMELAMPELDTSLLALMGISNGTYIGFKIPEKP